MEKESRSYEILGVEPDADTEQIKRAYSLLLKKHKDDQEKINQISRAYDELMGFITVDEEEEQKAKTGVGKFRDYWYHNKWPTIVAVIACFSLVVLIVNSFQSKPTDVSLHFVGNMFVRDVTLIEADIFVHLEDSFSPTVEFLQISGGIIPQMEAMAAARMKLAALVSAGHLDVIISDIESFEYLAGQGLLMPLVVTYDDDGLFIVKDGMNTKPDISQKEDPNLVFGTDNLGDEWLLGVRVDESEFLDWTNVIGDHLVVSMYMDPANYTLAFELIELVLNGDRTIYDPDEDEDEEW